MESTEPKAKNIAYADIAVTPYQSKVFYSFLLWMLKKNMNHDHVLESTIRYSEIFNPHLDQIDAFKVDTGEKPTETIGVLRQFVAHVSEFTGEYVLFQTQSVSSTARPLFVDNRKELVISSPHKDILLIFYRYCLYLFSTSGENSVTRKITLRQILHGDMTDFGQKLMLTNADINTYHQHVQKDINNLLSSTTIKGM